MARKQKSGVDVPYNLDTSPRQLGVGRWQGKIWMTEDFDELPLERDNVCNVEFEKG